MGLYRRTDSNVWWMSFTANRKTYQKSCGTTDKKLAEKILAKVQTQIVEEKWFEIDRAKQYTFGELMERYMKEVVCNKAIRTQETNRIQISNLRSFFGNVTLDKITPGLISQYRASRLDDGVKLQTIRYELVVMSHAFKIAQKEWQWVKSNPMSFITIPRQDNQIERWLTQEEQEKLLSKCEDWLKQLVLFALNTGMRMAEILELKWQNADLARKTVTIMVSKNGERRTLPINDIVVGILKGMSTGNRIVHIEGYVLTRDGKRIMKQELQYHFVKAVRNAKIAHFRFHDLRHTFATRLAQKGYDLYKISKLLGHKDIKNTQRYAHHCPESLRDGVDILAIEGEKNRAQLYDSVTLAATP